MTTTLTFINGEFVEGNKNSEKAMAKLEVDAAQNKSTLTFTADAGLIARRTASRQAENVCKSGFLLASGERIGIGTTLEVVEGDKLSDAHMREGHKYNRY